MKYVLYADLHLGSPIEIKPEKLFIAGENKILLGDIVDLANCKKDTVQYYRELHDELIGIHGYQYIRGNHERLVIQNEIITRNGVLFAHGDLEANPERWAKYRKKSHGAGWFKRKFIVPFIREAEEIIDRKPKQDFLDRAAGLATVNYCHTYVCGHFHVDEVTIVNHKNIKIVLLPRGKTEIEL